MVQKTAFLMTPVQTYKKQLDKNKEQHSELYWATSVAIHNTISFIANSTKNIAWVSTYPQHAVLSRL